MSPQNRDEKKKKAHKGVLSFAFEDGDDVDGGTAVALPPPKKPKPAVAASAEADATAAHMIGGSVRKANEMANA